MIGMIHRCAIHQNDHTHHFGHHFMLELDRFGEQQLYAVLILDDCGIDLERVALTGWAQAVSVLRQVGWSLALAEKVHINDSGYTL
jgi:hypothetical protein